VAPLKINLVEFAPKGPSRLIVHVHGAWQGRTPPRRRPVLVVDLEGRRRRFSPIQAPRRRSFDRFADWSTSFVVPASLGPALDGHMSLAFGDDELIPLPALFDPDATEPESPELSTREERMAARRPSSRLERRPVSENGRARRAARKREESRLSSASTRLRREVDRLQRELRQLIIARDKAIAERDKYYRTANDMARHVANMHSRMTAAVKAEKEAAEERDRLAQDLASLQGELYAAAQPTKGRAGTASRA